MKKFLSKKSVQAVCSMLLFSISFILLQYGLLNTLHGKSDAPLIVAIFGVFTLLVSYIFNLKALIITATFGYIVALILGLIFHSHRIDPIRGTMNNLWQIWLISYWVFIALGLIIDIVRKVKMQKHK